MYIYIVYTIHVTSTSLNTKFTNCQAGNISETSRKQPSLDRKNHKCQRPGFLKQETLAVVLNETVVKHVNLYTCQLARL